MAVLLKKAKPIKLVAFDVDGVMTNGQLHFLPDGSEAKVFNVQDGLGIKWLRQSDIRTAIITGRESEAVANRARQLGVDDLYQRRDDKLVVLKEIVEAQQLQPEQVAYLGDDLPDLPAIQYAGLGGTVANGSVYVKKHADWISSQAGGEGAVREFCEFILQAQGRLDAILKAYQVAPQEGDQ